MCLCVRVCVCVLCVLTSRTHCVAGEWQKHPPSELFRKCGPDAWDATLDHTTEWIAENTKTRAGRKRKRPVPVPPRPAPVSVVPPVVEVETPPAAESAALPELDDMLRDCQQIQRALIRLVRNIQKYKDAIEE